MAAVEDSRASSGPYPSSPDADAYMASIICLKRRADVDQTAHAILAAAGSKLCSHPSDALRSIIMSVCLALLERTSLEYYNGLARLHGTLCIGIMATTPSHIQDPTMCTAAGDLLSSRQLVRYHIFAVLRALWQQECAELASAAVERKREASLRRVTLCVFVHELWSHSTVTSRVLFDYMSLLGVASSRMGNLEANCLYSLLMQRGSLLYRQSETRNFFAQLSDRVTSTSSKNDMFDVVRKLLNNMEVVSSMVQDGLENRSLSGQDSLSRPAESGGAQPSPTTAASASDERLVLLGSLPRLDSKVEVSSSLRVVLLQVSWEDVDAIVLELVRWGMQYQNRPHGIGDLITLLYHEAASNRSWAKLYLRVFRDLSDTLDLGLGMTLAVVQGCGPRASGSTRKAETAIKLLSPAPPPQDDTLTGVWIGHLLARMAQTRRPALFAGIISSWVNVPRAGYPRSETLRRVVRLISRAASETSVLTVLYATLCRELVAGISDDVVDEGVPTVEEQASRGGQLFATILFQHCLLDLRRLASLSGPQRPRVPPLTARKYACNLASFVGELCNAEVLSRERVLTFLTTLLSDKADTPRNALIALDRFLRLVGRTLDLDSRDAMDACFDSIHDISQQASLTGDLLKILEDLVVLRDQGWGSSVGEQEIAKRSDIPV